MTVMILSGFAFYHRDLRRLVAIELKMEKFKPDFKGKWSCILVATNRPKTGRRTSDRVFCALVTQMNG